MLKGRIGFVYPKQVTSFRRWAWCRHKMPGMTFWCIFGVEFITYPKPQ